MDENIQLSFIAVEVALKQLKFMHKYVNNIQFNIKFSIKVLL